MKTRWLSLLLAIITVTGLWAGGQVQTTTPAATAEIARTGIYGEAPMLARRVQEGTLPPVDERLPVNPIVKEPPEEIGRYGGVVRLANHVDTEWTDFGSGRSSAMGWFKWNFQTGEIEGELAERFELSDDLTTYTIRFREGLRWSDGHPFTADDVMFAIHDKLFNTDYLPAGYAPLRAGGRHAEVTRIDDYTVRIQFAVANPSFMGFMVNFQTWQMHMTEPKHYLSQFHPAYNANATQLAADNGFDSWTTHFDWRRNIYSGQNDLDLPRLDPWIPVRSEPTRRVFTRNPYYAAVDTAGNQLPYLDGYELNVIASNEVLTLSTINGEFDFVAQPLRLESYPILKEKEQTDRTWPFRVFTVPQGLSAEYRVGFNQSYSADAVVAEILQDIRFREAFHTAIDREAINEVLYYGLGDVSPSWVPANRGASFYDPAWDDTGRATHNPQRAAQLLVEMGLTNKNRDGILLMRDGRPLTLLLETHVSDPRPFEMMKEDLAAVGISLDMRLYGDFPQVVARMNLATEIQIQATDGMGQAPEYVLWSNPTGNFIGLGAPGWSSWVLTDGRGDNAVEPPQFFKDWYAKVQEWQRQPLGSERYRQLGREITEEVISWRLSFGMAGYTPQPVVARRTLGNVVEPPVPWTWARDTMAQMRDTVFFRE
ncbi:MAG: hypothetical protein EA382_11775 [Spirochaetaceae bacterium]|nr:MAG: hypothetical protein EA382_11775 [Spirochaetaceae bacterium]